MRRGAGAMARRGNAFRQKITFEQKDRPPIRFGSELKRSRSVVWQLCPIHCLVWLRTPGGVSRVRADAYGNA